MINKFIRWWKGSKPIDLSGSEPIAAGDLVRVAKPTPCCNSNRAYGRVYAVQAIHECICVCQICGFVGAGPVAFRDSASGYPLSKLKRIPPFGELEKTQEKEE